MEVPGNDGHDGHPNGPLHGPRGGPRHTLYLMQRRSLNASVEEKAQQLPHDDWSRTTFRLGQSGRCSTQLKCSGRVPANQTQKLGHSKSNPPQFCTAPKVCPCQLATFSRLFRRFLRRLSLTDKAHNRNFIPRYIPHKEIGTSPCKHSVQIKVHPPLWKVFMQNGRGKKAAHPRRRRR